MLYILIFLLFLGLDQLVKYWAVTMLAPIGSITFIPNIISLTYAENKGAAFSMLAGARWFFVAVAVFFIVVLCIMFKKGYLKTWWSKFGASLLAAGAIGNAIDRLRHGFVVDMFELKFINFAIFNVADLLITAGGIILAVYILFIEGKDA